MKSRGASAGEGSRPTATARYVVGIDLGTTGSAAAVIDTQAGEDAPIVMLPVPQVIAPGQVEARTVLPSFLYLPAEHDLPAGSLAVPWAPDATDAVGELARARGAEVPARLVASAKSWLSNAAVDRRAPLLPWGAGEDVPKVSPVEASARYVAHLAGAWAAAYPDAPLGEQDVYLTVPASFDAVARELTMEAVRAAGLARVTLLEEPQAAFYSWLARTGEGWRKQLAVGDTVLVCDIGGGTTDFTLITVSDDAGNLELERVAVGDHILLGGDNMDLALAYAMTRKLGEQGTKLDAWQQRSLTYSCRVAKEVLLSDDRRTSMPITVLGRSSRLIGGTVKTELTRDEVHEVLVDGFFPRVDVDAKPVKARRTGFQELGLPYAADAGVTRHLAEFLGRHRRMPSAILYNGGVMKSDVLRGRLGDVLESWKGEPLKDLEGSDLDLAVAHGAAYYGIVRRGRGIRIRGGAARSYYIGVETAMPAVPGMPPPLKALCVVPFGMEEGTEAAVPSPDFGLIVGEPAEFRFFGSTSRREDRLGTVLEDWGDEVEELAPVETVLSGEGEGRSVPVRLEAHVTPVGTLELWCVSQQDDRRWKLEYNVREGQ